MWIKLDIIELMFYVFKFAARNKDGKPDNCKPIQKVEWKAAKSGYLLI